MTSKFMKYGTMSPTNIKEEHEGSGFIDDSLIISDTAVNINSSELNDDVKYSTTTAVDSIKNDFMFCEVANNIVNENDEMKVEVDDIKIIFKSERLFCDYCHEEYQGYCTKCGMVERILNGNMYNGAKDGIPNGILEIRYASDCFGIYTLKVIPGGVKFGPFTGLCTSNHSWRVKGGKLVLRDDKINNSNWMQYINSTENTFKGNLLVLQCEGCLYYHSSREIQIGEELLVYFGEEYEIFPKENAQLEFNPASDWKCHDVFACTFCCLGFSSELFLLRHKTVCPYKVNANLRAEELMQCPSCKIYLEQKEYSEYHATCCHEEMNRRLDLQIAELEAHSSGSNDEETKPDCEHESSRKSNLKTHVEVTHADAKKFKCAQCAYGTNRKSHLTIHVRAKHLKECDYKCADCAYETSYKAHLERHKAKHASEKNYKCAECAYRTGYKPYLERHVKAKHLQAVRYKCAQCDYHTCYNGNLEKHVKSKHLTEKAYECAECDYKTSCKSRLKRHVKVRHMNVKDYKCAECAYESSRKMDLDAHVKAKHLKEYDYKCAQCAFETCYKANLEAHVKTKHLREKDYKCAECAYVTVSEAELKRHARAKHVKETYYKCAQCAHKTCYKANLEKHTKAKHAATKSANFRIG